MLSSNATRITSTMRKVAFLSGCAAVVTLSLTTGIDNTHQAQAGVNPSIGAPATITEGPTAPTLEIAFATPPVKAVPCPKRATLPCT